MGRRVLLIACFAVLAAGCGATKVVTRTVTSNGPVRFGAGAQAFRTCLQQHGVALPKPQQQQRAFGPRTQTPAQQKAFQACRSKLPQGGGFFSRRNGGGPNNAFTKYTSCLKQHGVTFGKTSSGSAFKKAQAACRSLLPTRQLLKPATTTGSKS